MYAPIFCYKQLPIQRKALLIPLDACSGPHRRSRGITVLPVDEILGIATSERSANN